MSNNPNAFAKPNGTPNFTGFSTTPQQTNPAQQSGTQAGNAVNSQATPLEQTFGPVDIIEYLSAATRVVISGNGVSQIGGPNQFAARLSVSQGTLQLTGGCTDANNKTTQAVSPNQFSFVWSSNCRQVATVNSNGLVSLLKKGYATIECRTSRSVTLPAPAAGIPSPTDAVYATVDLTVLP